MAEDLGARCNRLFTDEHWARLGTPPGEEADEETVIAYNSRAERMCDECELSGAHAQERSLNSPTLTRDDVAEERMVRFGSEYYGVSPTCCLLSARKAYECATREEMSALCRAKAYKDFTKIQPTHISVLTNHVRMLPDEWYAGNPNFTETAETDFPMETYLYFSCFVTPDPAAADYEHQVQCAEDDKRICRFVVEAVARGAVAAFRSMPILQSKRDVYGPLLDWTYAGRPQIRPDQVRWRRYPSLVMASAQLPHVAKQRSKGPNSKAWKDGSLTLASPPSRKIAKRPRIEEDERSGDGSNATVPTTAWSWDDEGAHVKHATLKCEDATKVMFSVDKVNNVVHVFEHRY